MDFDGRVFNPRTDRWEFITIVNNKPNNSIGLIESMEKDLINDFHKMGLFLAQITCADEAKRAENEISKFWISKIKQLIQEERMKLLEEVKRDIYNLGYTEFVAQHMPLVLQPKAIEVIKLYNYFKGKITNNKN